jgi:hypothetical protein
LDKYSSNAFSIGNVQYMIHTSGAKSSSGGSSRDSFPKEDKKTEFVRKTHLRMKQG